jgi:DNA-binding response OmpR family regulator
MTDTCSVLVVEDDAGVRTMLADALHSEGFAVRSASNGRDALAVLDRWHPDLIVTDLHMPMMDGWTLLAELRRRADVGNIPVVVISAGPWDQIRIEGLDAAAYVKKPCDIDALLSAIRQAVGNVEVDALEAFPRLSSRGDTAALMMEVAAVEDAERGG